MLTFFEFVNFLGDYIRYGVEINFQGKLTF